jgi:hypothetical protein
MKLSTALLASLAPFAFVALAACGTAGSAGKPDKPPVPPMEDPHAKPANDLFMDDVKTAVAGQLECPVEEINLTCVKRDQQGECVAVRGDGCNKTVEYQFGDPG